MGIVILTNAPIILNNTPRSLKNPGKNMGPLVCLGNVGIVGMCLWMIAFQEIIIAHAGVMGDISFIIGICDGY